MLHAVTNNSFSHEDLIFHVSKWFQVHATLIRSEWGLLQSSTSGLVSPTHTHSAITETHFVQDQSSQTLNMNFNGSDRQLYQTCSSQFSRQNWLVTPASYLEINHPEKRRKLNEISVLHSPFALQRFLKCCLSDVPCSLITGSGLWRPFAELLLFCVTTFSIFHRLAFMNRLWSICEASL